MIEIEISDEMNQLNEYLSSLQEKLNSIETPKISEEFTSLIARFKIYNDEIKNILQPLSDILRELGETIIQSTSPILGILEDLNRIPICTVCMSDL